MTQDERDALGKALTSAAFLYGHEFPRERASMFISAILDFMPSSLGEYLVAIKQYTQDPRNRTFPTPAQLRPYLFPEMSTDAKANESASRIRSAITKFGWPDPEGAKRFIGDLGWAVVQRSGGWQYICENHGLVLSPTTFHAQARDSAKAILESAAVGQLDQPIAIGQREPNRSIGLSKPIDVIQLVGMKDGDQT